jgi:hypothetical protein
LSPDLSKLSSLCWLDISNNHLTGKLPATLVNMECVRSFKINGNSLTGEIPEGLLEWSNLEAESSDLRWNGLYSSNLELTEFLNSKQISGNWTDSQTITPSEIWTIPLSETEISVCWTPIQYTQDPGGYDVSVSLTAGGIYVSAGITADKTISCLDVPGLDEGTCYYFRVQTVTRAHPFNSNDVFSEPGLPLPGCTRFGTVTPSPTPTPVLSVPASNAGGILLALGLISLILLLRQRSYGPIQKNI